MRRLRTVTRTLPTRTGRHQGLAYTIWRPGGAGRIRAGVVLLHGAGSQKESHYDFARALVADGYAALAFDARGHGESEGPMDERAADDVVAMAALLREHLADLRVPLALRGSSMGGYLALVCAAAADARAVVAIAPAPAALLRRHLRDGSLSFSAAAEQLESFLDAHELGAALTTLRVPALVLHAEGDERVPVQSSLELRGMLPEGSRLIVVPGGHHRSIQHDPDLQATTLRWLGRALGR
jgi:pimeloyl-ACP methyl ester carboxylesterase